jgi:hypothetical protein
VHSAVPLSNVTYGCDVPSVKKRHHTHALSTRVTVVAVRSVEHLQVG